MRNKIGHSIWYKNIDIESAILKEVGFDFVELHLSLNGEFNDKIKSALPILSLHLPEIDFKREEMEKCKELIETFPCKLFIIHLFSRNLPTEKYLGEKIGILKELTSYAQKHDRILALENTEEDAKILKKVFDNIPELSFCLDIGHAHLFTNPIDLINEFSEILAHIHVHDNVGGHSEKFDLHLPIGAGRINFDPIFDKLKEINYSGNFTLEIYNDDKEYRRISLERVRNML